MNTMRKNIYQLLFGFGALLLPLTVSAQEADASFSLSEQDILYIVLGLVVVVVLLVLVGLIAVLRMMQAVLLKEQMSKSEEAGVAFVPEPSIFQKWMANMTRSVPVEQEATVMLDHDYDGIKELNNHLPPWWLYLFYGSIAFSIVYLAVYHVFGTLPLSKEEYQIAVLEAEEARSALLAEVDNSIDEITVTITEDAGQLAVGKAIYNGNCAACHKESGAGGIGPNLTDQYWIHGGGIADIFKTIKYGIPEKGMVSWQNQLNPEQIRNVSSYILTLQGTNPENPKAPQGELYIPPEPEEVPADSVSAPTDEENQLAQVSTQ